LGGRGHLLGLGGRGHLLGLDGRGHLLRLDGRGHLLGLDDRGHLLGLGGRGHLLVSGHGSASSRYKIFRFYFSRTTCYLQRYFSILLVFLAAIEGR
jgi:hypothetical protein